MSNFDSAACAALLEELTAISIAAAEAIRSMPADRGVRLKADGSPVTAADEAAEAVIRDGLARLGLPLPVISEESADLAGASIAAPSFILVDPLDGTREFIAGRDEYTDQYRPSRRRRPRRRRHHGAGARAHLARRRRPRRRAAAIFRRTNVSAGENPNAAPPRRRPAGHGEPIAPRCPDGGLSQALARSAAGGVRFSN